MLVTLDFFANVMGGKNVLFVHCMHAFSDWISDQSRTKNMLPREAASFS